jgi:hypothetical protein
LPIVGSDSTNEAIVGAGLEVEVETVRIRVDDVEDARGGQDFLSRTACIHQNEQSEDQKYLTLTHRSDYNPTPLILPKNNDIPYLIFNEANVLNQSFFFNNL